MKEDMKKIIKEITINTGLEINVDYVFGDRPTPIDELIKHLNESKKDKATHVKINGFVGSSEDLYAVVIETIKIEEESDEEYNKRKQDEESIRLANQNVEKAQEKALYEELKLKYGKATD